MTNKEYLSQYGYIRQQLSDRLDEVREINRLRYSISTSFDPVRTGNGASSGKMARLLAKVEELEEQVRREVEHLSAKRAEIESAISGIEEEQLRTLLEKRYIHLKSLEQISVEMGYGYRHICRLHGQALQKITCP